MGKVYLATTSLAPLQMSTPACPGTVRGGCWHLKWCQTEQAVGDNYLQVHFFFQFQRTVQWEIFVGANFYMIGQ